MYYLFNIKEVITIPIPTFTGLGPNPQFEDVVRKVNTLVNEIRQLMLGMDSVNMFEVGGWLVTQDELASQDGDVGMSTAGTAATSIRFWAGNAIPASAPFRVQQDGKMYATDGEFTGNITGSTITGGTIQTAASGNRIVITNNSLKTYNGANLNGFAWGTDVAGPTFGDAFLYHAGNKKVDFYDNISNFSIKASGADGIIFGGGTGPTYANGTWSFGDTGSADMQGTFKVHSGTAFDTLSQADSTATDVATLKTDFNALLSKLRSMNILAP